MVEPAPDHGRFDAAGLGAEALMVPVASFQGVLDEEPELERGVVILAGFMSAMHLLRGFGREGSLDRGKPESCSCHGTPQAVQSDCRGAFRW